MTFDIKQYESDGGCQYASITIPRVGIIEVNYYPDDGSLRVEVSNDEMTVCEGMEIDFTGGKE